MVILGPGQGSQELVHDRVQLVASGLEVQQMGPLGHFDETVLTVATKFGDEANNVLMRR